MDSQRIPGREAVRASLRPVLGGLFAAVIVTLTLWVAIALGSEERSLVALVSPTALRALPSPTSTTPPSATPSPSPRPTLSPVPPSATALPTEEATAPIPTGRTAEARCVPPSTWQLYTVRAGETLQSLAWRYWTTDYNLVQTNCLTSWTLTSGQRLYVPGVSPRQTCGRPPGWVAYIIQRGDTLSGLARRLGVSITTLKNANCLVGDTIYAGATLWVPRPLATATRYPTWPPPPSATPRPTSTSSQTPTPGGTPPTGSVTPEDTNTPAATDITPSPETPPATGTSLPPTATSEPIDSPEPPTSTTQPTDVPPPPSSTPLPPPPTSTPLPPPTNTPVPSEPPSGG